MTIHTGDCVEVMAAMEPASVDAIVCDPPYGFTGGFMSKAWDRFTGEDIDAGFLHWFAGFVDGEGCFSVHRKPQATFDCQFSIALRADDRPILERIHRTLGIGTLSKPTAHRTGDENPKARFSVSSKGDCVRLRDIFRAFPLRAKKALDFEEWSEALDAWLSHETGEWSDMAESRDRLMASRAYKPEGVRVDPYQLWTIRWAREALRVLKPGAWLIAAGAPKKVHRMAAGLEDAGFEIRDMVLHCFASGFPKGRANLKPAYEPWILAKKPGPMVPLGIDAARIGISDWDPEQHRRGSSPHPMDWGTDGERALSEPGAGRWPANVVLTDPIFDGGWDGVVGGSDDVPAATSFSRHGTGIFDFGDQELQPGYADGGGYSRFFLVPKASRADREPNAYGRMVGGFDGLESVSVECEAWEGAARKVRLQVDTARSAIEVIAASGTPPSDAIAWNTLLFGSGLTARFRLVSPSTIGTTTSSTTGSRTLSWLTRSFTNGSIPAANSETANGGSLATDAESSSLSLTITNVETVSLPNAEPVPSGTLWRISSEGGSPRRVTTHPTVKPLALMRHLVRLVTPSGGTVLDPFAGSGTTLLAAEIEGFPWIGIEKDESYVKIIEARLAGVQRGMGLEVA